MEPLPSSNTFQQPQSGCLVKLANVAETPYLAGSCSRSSKQFFENGIPDMTIMHRTPQEAASLR
jgi:hypothetical protein